MIRSVFVIATLISLSLQGWVPAVAQRDYQANSASIFLSPPAQTAAAGQTVSFYVNVGSVSGRFRGGYAVVEIPNELAINGPQECSVGCGHIYVMSGQTGGQIQTAISLYEGEQATFAFDVTIPINVSPGTTYELAAYLLGGIDVTLSSHASISSLRVVAPTAIPTSPSLPDNRTAYPDISPSIIHIAPGGKVLYYIQPIFWGEWNSSQSDYSVTFTVPKGMSLAFPPNCGERSSAIPMQSPCDVETTETQDGGTLLTLRPGYSQAATNGIYLILRVESAAKPTASFHLSASMTVIDPSFSVRPDPSSSYARVVEEESLITPQFQGGKVSGLLEVRSGFSESAEGCSSDRSNSTVLSLYEWGNSKVIATTTLSEGIREQSTDATSQESCFIPFTFDGVPSNSIYIVATGADMGGGPCRACVLGIITSGEYVDQILDEQ